VSFSNILISIKITQRIGRNKKKSSTITYKHYSHDQLVKRRGKINFALPEFRFMSKSAAIYIYIFYIIDEYLKKRERNDVRSWSIQWKREGCREEKRAATYSTAQHGREERRTRSSYQMGRMRSPRPQSHLVRGRQFKCAPTAYCPSSRRLVASTADTVSLRVLLSARLISPVTYSSPAGS